MKETVNVETKSGGTKLRRPPRRPGTLKSERVEEMLKAMPDWSLAPKQTLRSTASTTSNS